MDLCIILVKVGDGVRKEEHIRWLIGKYEKEYIKFMEIESFPSYKVELFEIEMDEVDAVGFGAPAQARYNPKTDEHILRICSNLELKKCVVFHEFTHILDTEMYANRDSCRYMYLSGYTEYHASQVELMFLLGAESIHSTKVAFSLNSEIETFPSKKSIEEYLCVEHQLVVDMMSRADFPVNIETLKATLGVLYNYFGLRSICKMYVKNYAEQVDNTAIIKILPLPIFSAINTFMEGWFDKSKVETSFGLYCNAIMPLIKTYKLL